MKFIIAIDGPAASGKGTIASALAKRLNFRYLNTGALYRLVALHVIKHGIDIKDRDKIVESIQEVNFEDINNPDLYREDVSRMSSVIAAVPEIRAALLQEQRSFPKENSGSILEGRDIGTVIFPDADLKLYITASLEERARRRFKQLQSRSQGVIYNEVLNDIKERDLRDLNRENAPLTKSADYHVLDTTNLDIESSIADIMYLIKKHPFQV